jgi:hypothetical protein
MRRLWEFNSIFHRIRELSEKYRSIPEFIE